jgi:PKD repeat protein
MLFNPKMFLLIILWRPNLKIMKSSKKIIIVALCLITSVNVVNSQSISIQNAKEIAKNQFIVVRQTNLKVASQKQTEVSLSSISLDETKRDTLYYVFNDTINNGFVIVAADRRIWPILGFSTEGRFNENDQPPAFIDWMKSRKMEIEYIISNSVAPDSLIIQKWNNLYSSTPTSGTTANSSEPLLKTTWDQGCFYNTKCPIDSKGDCGHVWTGCTATSMAQILKYWNYPTTGSGSHQYYHSQYGTISANFGTTTYQWSQMPNKLTSNNEAVATLIFHCGVSVDMNYNINGSGAWDPSAFAKYFKYSSNIKFVQMNSYSYSEWVNILKSELDANRPILYRGQSTQFYIPEVTSAHAFVCDGYKDSDYFHFNWGWSGSADNYFYINKLNPNSDFYSFEQGAVIGIEPATTNQLNNDNCSDAKSLTIGTTYDGTLDGATNDGFPNRPSCDTFSGVATQKGVFYKFVATSTSHTITVRPKGVGTSAVDAVVAIYSGSGCYNLSEIDCFGGSGSSGGFTKSKNIAGLSVGQTYWVRIYDYGLTDPTYPEFTICVSQLMQLCSYSLSRTSQNFTSFGGKGSFIINTVSGLSCNWNVSTLNPGGCGFVALTSKEQGTDTYTIDYDVAQNTTLNARSCTIRVNGNNGYSQDYVITQDASGVNCIAPVSPTSATASQTTIMAGQSATLQVVGGSLNSASNWVWYSGGCGNTPINTGSSIVVWPTTTTTYYVNASACGSTTTCRSVTVYVSNQCSSPSAPASLTTSIGNPPNGFEHVINMSCALVQDAEGYSYEYSFDGKEWVQNWQQKQFNSIGIVLSDSPNFPIYCRVRAYKCNPRQYSSYTYATPQPIYTACDEPAAPYVTKGVLPKTLEISLRPEYRVENPSYTTYSIYCISTNQYVQLDGTLGNNQVFQTKNDWGTKTIPGISNNKEYCFYAKARNVDGDIRYSDWNIRCYSIYQPTVAKFSSKPVNDCDPLTIAFTDESQGDIVSWNWDINSDGKADYFSKNPIHTFMDFGSHYVTLTVTNDVGLTSYTYSNVYISSQPTLPSIPTSHAATNIRQTVFTANWNDVPNTLGYRIDVSTNIAFSTFVLDFKDKDIGNVTSYNLTNLSPNTTFYYRVKAYNICGQSQYSGVISITTLPDPPPAPLAVQASSILQTSFTANWNQSASATGYYLDVSKDLSFTTFLNGLSNKDLGNIQLFSISGLIADTKYYYRVRAYNTGGSSTYSNTISLTTLPNPPSAPNVNYATSISQTSFIANWDPAPTATGYLLDVSSSVNFNSYISGFQNKDVGNVLKYDVVGLNPYTKYYYRLRAYNTGGTSGNSLAVNMTTLTIPPSAPLALVASSCNNLVTLIWEKTSDLYVARYRIYCGTSLNTTTKIDSTKGTDATIVLSGLKQDQTYYFLVTAVNFDGPESKPSLHTSIKVKTGVIPTISIKWGDLLICSNIDKLITNYQWYRSNNLIPNAVLQYFQTNKKAGEYSVLVTDINGCKNYSNSIPIYNLKSLVVYPSPASSSFELKLLNSPNDSGDVSIYNSAGVKVIEFRAESIKNELLKEISVHNLNDGVYVIQVIMSNGEFYTTKIIVKK